MKKERLGDVSPGLKKERIGRCLQDEKVKNQEVSLDEKGKN